MARILMKGNEAIAEAAIRADADAYFGYPITPQNEIPEYLAREMPKHGKIFLQSESELAGINMAMGAAAAGARAFVSSSSPGVTLMLECISSMMLTRLPCVVINMVRSGPGMGDLKPAQEDYRMCGNGAYRIPTLLPANIQEAMNFTFEAFDIADQYRTPVMVLADGMIGQMMEAVDFDKLPARRENLPEKDWIVYNRKAKGGKRRQMSLHPDGNLAFVTHMLESEVYPQILANEGRVEEIGTEDADIILCAYGTASRYCRVAMEDMSKELNIKIGLIRPMTAWPFRYDAFDRIGKNCKAIIVPEICIMGQMIDDARIGAAGRWPVYHCGNTIDGPLTPENIYEKIREIWEEVKKC